MHFSPQLFFQFQLLFTVDIIQSKVISLVFDKTIFRRRGSLIDSVKINSSKVALRYFFSSSLRIEYETRSLNFKLKVYQPYLCDPQSVLSWSNILMTLPQRSGLESSGHIVTVGKTMSSIGKVRTTDLIGFSCQPASLNSKYKAGLVFEMYY